MTKIKKLFAIILSVLAVGAMFMTGCDGNGGGDSADNQPAGTNKIVENVATAPDYSATDKKLNMYAYVGPTPGVYTDADGNDVKTEDFRTEARYKEYKDCGFDTLLLLGNDGYIGETFEASNLKKNLDLCEKVGLNCIVFDARIEGMTELTASLIGNGMGQYKDIKALSKKIGEMIEPYADHPAFYGLSIKDEPTCSNFAALGEVYKAVDMISEERAKAGKNKIYLNCVMLPYVAGRDGNYTSNSVNTGKQAYRDYISKYLTKTGSAAFDYDSYPFIYAAPETSDESAILNNYLSNLQMVSEETSKAGKSFYLTMQSHSSVRNAEGSANKRAMTIADFRWQLNAAFSFGVKDLRYYTYWMFPNHSASGDPMDKAVMSDRGEKQYYDMVQATTAEAKKQAEVVLNFEYKKTALGYDDASYPAHFAGVKDSEQLDGIVLTATAGTVFNEMYDKANDRKGYYVFNAEDPADNKTTKISMKFNGYKYVAVYKAGERTLYELNNGTYYTTFEKGDGAFIIPFN